MKRRQVQIIGLFALVVVLVAGVALALRSKDPEVVVDNRTPVVPTIGPKPRPGYTAVPSGELSPVVLQRMPERGEELSPSGAVELVFDREMDRAAVEQALHISPAVAGKVEWTNARTVRFVPSKPLERGALYDVVLDQSAKAVDGARLKSPYQFRFATAGFLEVGQMLPADGSDEVEAASPITVIFSRPVVPLLVVEEQDTLPQPLSFEPAIAGKGEWLNTSIYIFKPDAPLAGGTTYTVRVSGDLKDLAGNPLSRATSWSFTTTRPKVLYVSPTDQQQLVSVEPTITLQFNQPLDQASAQGAFHLLDASRNEVPGTVKVLSETLIFTPNQRLEFDQRYTIVADAGLGGRSGGVGMAEEYRSSFQTVPLPRILRTRPADGDLANPYTSFEIVFNTPIDPATVMENLEMTPALSPTLVYTYFNDYDQTFSMNFGPQPSSDYQVRIGPNIRDPYGNRTGQTLVVNFRTDKLPPTVSMAIANGIGTYNASSRARIGLTSINQGQARLALYQLSADDLKNPYTGDIRPAGAKLLRSWTEQLESPLDKQVISLVDLVEGGGQLAPGVYQVELDQPGGYPQIQKLVVSELNLTLKSGERDALVWANRIDTGEPVSGLALDLFDEQGTPLGSVTTNADGIGITRLQRTENRGLLAIAREPFAAMGAGWSQSVNAWEFGLPGVYDLPELTGHIYTDRPIYRPGQRVELKGVLRAEDDVRFSLPTQRTVQLTVSSPNGEQVLQKTVTLNANGTFAEGVDLSDGATLGYYSISALVEDRFVFNGGFTVAAYRAPEFQVAVKPAQPEIVRGEATSATAQVTYFFGGPVANAPVTWNVLADPYHFAPDWASRYQFSGDNNMWRCWECWWMPSAPQRVVLTGSGTTDAQGNLVIQLPAELKDQAGTPITDSVRLTIEATVTGKDNQVISGRETLVVHSGAAYIGLAAQNYIGEAGKELKVDLVTASMQGQRLPNQTVDVEVFEITYKNTFIEREGGGSWSWTEQRRSVSRQQVRTDGTAAATVGFTPAEGGSYQVVATMPDGRGHTVRSTLFLWVAGEGYVSWRRDNDDRVNLISDKTSYKVGERASILIPSPFQGPHWALISVERGGILSHEVRRVETNSLVYELPITAQHAPNIYVSVVLLTAPEAAGRTADYKVGVLPLTVEPEPQTLKVQLTPSETKTRPGSKVRYDVLVTDGQGQPVAAELSLDLVDKAVLSLSPRAENAIREAFYAKRGLAITTSVGLAISAERIQEELEEQLRRQREERQNQDKGADQDAREEGESAAGGMPQPTAGDGNMAPGLVDEEAAPPAEPRAARGAVAQAAVPEVRGEFADTAYWKAELTTEPDGRGSVELELPDNLTTWVMRGVGLNQATQVGEGTVEVVATMPLLIRPVTPRFFVVGDVVELAANVSNNTDGPLSVEVGLATEGLSVTGSLTQTVSVPANGEARVTWQATAQDVVSAELIFSAVSGQYADASKPRLASAPDGRLPVYRYSAPEVIGTGGQIEGEDLLTEVIGLPSYVDPRSGELTVRLDPSLAAGMRDGLKYLEEQDWECTEHTVSMFLPNLLTAQALKELGIANQELEAALPGLLKTGLERLQRWQHGDGGWGWCHEEKSNVHTSAYVVFALIKAQQAGHAVDADVLQRGLDYLKQQLVATKDLNSVPQANQQAWILYVLAEGSQPDAAGRLGELYDKREKLSTFARALLAMALNSSGVQPDDARIKTLLSDLRNAAILSATGAHWEEEQRDWWSMNSDTRSTAIILEALVRLDPNSDLNPNVVRWLMVARKDGIWETTQETAWSLIALTSWMRHTGELKPNYDYAAALNGQPLAEGHVGQEQVDEPIVLRIKVADLLVDTGNQLQIGRGPGDGRLYYTAHLRAFLPVEEIKALDRGIVLSRRYTLASCQDGPKCPEVTEAKVGDIIRVEVSLVAPHDLYYLVLEDPIPAGAELIDTGLATTSLLSPSPTLQNQNPGGPWIEEDAPGRASERIAIDWYWGWWHWYSRSELRDEKVALFADYVGKGSYIYSYTMRATLPGEYHVIPTTASETYFPEVYGRADGRLLRITE